jgi:hypothetical protein
MGADAGIAALPRSVAKVKVMTLRMAVSFIYSVVAAVFLVLAVLQNWLSA